MKSIRRHQDSRDYLKRLPPAHYQGQAYVHWSMTMEDRKQGWLNPALHLTFREMLTHTVFRYGLCCPIYCCMPDHIHFLWIGILDLSDQRNAAKYIRRQLNLILEPWGARLQKQPYDHVLRDDEKVEGAFETIAEYIARNPERAGLTTLDGFRDYPYTNCLVPGYPELHLWQKDFWPRFWRIYSFLRQNGVVRPANENLDT